MLAGDGTFDYKNVQGEGDNLIPPMMANTPSGLSPSDAWFVEREKASQREIAIGRLPVTTPGELAEVIRKILARESALALGEPWLRNTLLVADNADAAGDFLLSSERVASLVPAGLPVARAYISVAGAAQARSDLIGAMNEGAGAVSYFGHGGFDQLADESLLTSADAAGLVNRDRPTVMTAMTCLAGNSACPATRSSASRSWSRTAVAWPPSSGPAGCPRTTSPTTSRAASTPRSSAAAATASATPSIRPAARTRRAISPCTCSPSTTCWATPRCACAEARPLVPLQGQSAQCYHPRMSSPRLERSPDLIERRVADETFLLPVKGAPREHRRMFALSEVGQFIWSLADGTRGVPELIAEVVREFEVPEDQARNDVAEFVGRLRAYGLVKEVTD